MEVIKVESINVEIPRQVLLSEIPKAGILFFKCMVHLTGLFR